MTIKIAIDLDSTLADVTPVVFDLLGEEYDYDDVRSWEWPINTFGKEAFLAAAWAVWPIRRPDIPLSDGAAPAVMKRLCEDHTVDIVTQQGESPYVDQAKQDWLADHQISYNQYRTVTMDESKSRLGYEIYLDDNPALAQELAQTTGMPVIYDRRYNRDLRWPHMRATNFRQFELLVDDYTYDGDDFGRDAGIAEA